MLAAPDLRGREDEEILMRNRQTLLDETNAGAVALLSEPFAAV